MGLCYQAGHIVHIQIDGLAVAISIYCMTFALPVPVAPYLFTGGPSPGNISPSYVKTANSTAHFLRCF